MVGFCNFDGVGIAPVSNKMAVKCDLCDASFSRRNIWTKHISAVHEGINLITVHSVRLPLPINNP